MMLSKRAIEQGDATLLVFSPDAVASQLIPTLQGWVEEQTGFRPVAASLVYHTRNSIELFYARSQPQDLRTWELVCELFLKGPSVATIWQGSGALAALPTIKGRSHPGLAKEGTIRGGFWCDNPITNLVHMSDDVSEALREIAILEELNSELFHTQAPHLLTTDSPAEIALCWRHSGILTLCQHLLPFLNGGKNRELLPPADGNARQTMHFAEAWLAEAKSSLPRPAAVEILGYITGDADPETLIGVLRRFGELSKWSAFVITCGLVTRKGWRSL